MKKIKKKHKKNKILSVSPEFDFVVLDNMKDEKQRPSPAGGGILKEEWFKPWKYEDLINELKKEKRLKRLWFWIAMMIGGSWIFHALYPLMMHY
jgi:hypothetical protein